MINPLIGLPQGAEWFVILAIVILVFGAAKLPDLARSTGQALKIFKTETKGLIDDKDGKKTQDADSTDVTVAGELPAGTATQTSTQTSTQPTTQPTPAAPVTGETTDATSTEHRPG